MTTGRRVTVGVVKRPHGIRGGVLVGVMTDHPGRFEPGERMRISGPLEQDVVIASTQPHREGVLVYFEGFPDRNAAETIVGRTITIDERDRRRLTLDEFWPDDLIGRRAVAVDGTDLGTVADVVLGPQDRLVVRTLEGTSVEVPFVAAIVPAIEETTVTIDPPEGLF